MNNNEMGRGSIIIEGATLIFKNFQGKEGDYNRKGDRNFGVLIDDDLAEDLIRDGWNVKHLRPREDDPEQHQQAWLKVNVSYKYRPPIVNIVTSKGKKKIGEEEVDQLDWMRMKEVDVKIVPHHYQEKGKRPAGISAYLRSIYVVVEEDDLDLKYADIPDLED